MAILLGLATMLSTLFGGMFALRKQDKLHMILGFSAGAVIGVAFFDLMPEAFDLAGAHYDAHIITTVIAFGFLIFMLLNQLILIHPHSKEEYHHDSEEPQGPLGAASLSIHSFLDGVGIGLAFQISPAIGAIVAVAVLAHDFSDGINTVSFILRHKGNNRQAFRWLALDALAPLLGVISTRFFTISQPHLGLLLAMFCGFFLYIGASDLLPESHHQHPKLVTSFMTILGAAVIYIAIHFASI